VVCVMTVWICADPYGNVGDSYRLVYTKVLICLPALKTTVRLRKKTDGALD
jgi:hypothetical protein